MSQGFSIAQVHEVLTQRVDDLKKQSVGLYKAAAEGARRPWMMPEGWVGGLFDIAGITTAFKRDAINQNYEKALSDNTKPGTTGDCIALKIQADWLAVRERAFRLRHATSIRCEAHSAARRLGHGTPGGVYDTTVVKYTQDVIRQGVSRHNLRDIRNLRNELIIGELPKKELPNPRLDNLDRDQPIFVVPL